MIKKLIVILGPTASGKSALAVRLAKKFNGEIISADSRQVYKGMDIGTGKIAPDTKNSSNFSTGQAKKKYIFTHKGIPHYCLDVASPRRRFTVAQYRKLALRAIDKIFGKNKIPILCGGTGFYIQAVIDGIIIPEVRPDRKLRKKLEKKTTKELFNKLKKMDQKRAETIDRNNRRRLIRALEIVIKTKKPVPALKKSPLPFPILMIGIKKEGKENKFSSSPFAAARVNEELKKLIEKRLLKRLKAGMIDEARKLHKDGVPWKRLEEFGLEYRFAAQYLQKKLKYEEMVNLLQKEIEHFAKRQITWFKKDKRIIWVKSYQETEKIIKDFLE